MNKRILSLAAALLLILAAVSAAGCSSLPSRVEWSGALTSWVTGEYVESEISLNLAIKKPPFSSPVYTGTVTIDGVVYADIADQKWADGNPFVPLSLKQNLAGNQVDIYSGNWVTLDTDSSGKYLTICLHRPNDDANLIYDLKLD